MAGWVVCAALATGAVPLARAWLATRASTLQHAVSWLAAAWLLWLLAQAADSAGDVEEARAGRYVALAVTACAGVAVLGARRPGVGPWNFVVCGLLAVFVLPIVDPLEMRFRQEPLPLFFLGGTLVLGVLNYLPTRGGAAAVLAGVGCGLAFAEEAHPELVLARGLCLALAPWLGWVLLGRRPAGRELDAAWWRFRDGFGALWAQRVREQMNRTASNSGWPLVLSWHGFESRGPGGPPDETVLATLRALLQRFDRDGPADRMVSDRPGS